MRPSQVLKSLQQEKRNVERSQDLHLIRAHRQRLYSSFCSFSLPHFRIFSLVEIFQTLKTTVRNKAGNVFDL